MRFKPFSKKDSINYKDQKICSNKACGAWIPNDKFYLIIPDGKCFDCYIGKWEMDGDEYWDLDPEQDNDNML